jgi:hypothetical protein
VAGVVLDENDRAPLIAVMPAIADVLTILFFVRVNQVLVRLWARAVEAALYAVFVPLSG